ncbi:hypothetical protein [Microcoleus sp.]|uniref:hypothetical protein n=1 Tax=Microcoleus sp. TaxID=44472 RepID=UPI0035246CDA
MKPPCLGTGWRGLRYKDVEVERSDSEAPKVGLHGTDSALASTWGNCQWQLSLSHDGDYCRPTAIALCSPHSTTSVPPESETQI